jgi:hypothetical protein
MTSRKRARQTGRDVSADLDLKQDAALFAEMLSVPNDGRYPALELEPQQRRQKTLEALTARVEALPRQKPLLMIFEDGALDRSIEPGNVRSGRR